MKHPPRSNRRHFLRHSACLTLGTVAAGSGFAMGETDAESTLRRTDGELARVLRSYGTTRSVEPAGSRVTRLGSRTRRLPVSRLRVDVADREAFLRSFERLTTLSDRVMVHGNEASFVRGGRLVVIDNRIG